MSQSLTAPVAGDTSGVNSAAADPHLARDADTGVDPPPAVGVSAPPVRRRGARVWVRLLAGVVILAALFLAGWARSGFGGRAGQPGDASAEAGFARDMQTHHSQAVQMALTIRDKTGDPTLRAVAYDIITGQQQQSGQMYAWLIQWGLPQTGSAKPMAWMSASGHNMGGMTAPITSHRTGGAAPRSSAAMPGMASTGDLQRLQPATGVDAERQFLTLMMAHHNGGVQMAQAVLERTTRPEVVTLAQAIRTAQSAEIEQLTTLLTARTGQ